MIEYDGRDEQTLAEAIDLGKQFRDGGLDFMSVSLGFSTPQATPPWGPAFLAPIAERVRRETGLPAASAWGFGRPDLAEQAVKNEQLDAVMIGRGHLENPHWPYHTAKSLGLDQPASVLPSPYSHWLARYTM